MASLFTGPDAIGFQFVENTKERVRAPAPSGREIVAAFSRCLKRIALRTPWATVLAAVGAMRTRADQIWAAGGKDIARD